MTWEEHKGVLITTVEDLKHEVHELRVDVKQCLVDIAKLQGKAGTWGALMGAVFGGMITLLVNYVLKN